MSLNVEDKGYLWDIMDACNDITNFLNNKTYESFMNDKLTRFAVERQLLVIGEASKKLSDSTRQNNNEIQWKRIIGLRNIIAHEYGDLLVERIWKIAKNDIPILRKQIELILEDIK